MSIAKKTLALVTVVSALQGPLAHSTELDADQRLNAGETVLGGTVQSTDPSRYDYVSPNSEADQQLRSAAGYAFVPGFMADVFGAQVNIPSGQIFHRINGSGTHIDFETATYTTAANICNYRIDYQNRDINGHIVATHSNGNHLGCAWGMVGDQGIHNLNVQPGMMCARLFVSGAFRGEQCHHITP